MCSLSRTDRNVYASDHKFIYCSLKKLYKLEILHLSSGEHISLINVDDNAMESTKNKIVEILQLNDDDNQDSIVPDVLNNGRQALVKYEQDIIPEIYTDVMKNDDNKLMTSLKKFFQQQWETQYGSSHQWFISFLKGYEVGENVDVFQRVLNRTAEYGNRFIKHCPLLSIVLQLVFESIGDEELLEANVFDDRYLKESNVHNIKCLEERNVCDELWFSITNDGLTSITKYPEYIIEDVMNQQLDKTQSTLFHALRVYYRPQLFSLLEIHKIPNRGNLYDLLLENVAEHGWLMGLETIQRQITPRSYSNLSTSINSLLEQRKAQKQKVQQQSIRKNEDEVHLETNNVTSNNIQSESSNANLTTASSKESGS
ncbi:unnamed protein product [Didymodactylos carnosus]|uniref:Uncharacterized protein n=1 Tax=Didymodactylos carnosus TaxID=1234261 RepID=A0A814Q086_9BILA|nr:unnamed protein product [Didymodactylos carnosus]CAF1112681.1 unnamed protein product [Didymodactylos carnosus]CAF3617791.1 unnamed protein product [Didymodactylos carnosus]CAF3876879.1 unnamed protein product [Didymodactylos carnosus]